MPGLGPFSEGDPSITNQKAGKVENPDIADCYNTVLKISKKRAYVDATIAATAASDIFTQDLEDLTESRQETMENLAADAASGSQGSIADAHGGAEDRATALAGIAEIMNSVDPDQCPWFSETEKAQERAAAQGAGNVRALENQRDRLWKELKKRKAEYQPVPFGNSADNDDFAASGDGCDIF